MEGIKICKIYELYCDLYGRAKAVLIFYIVIPLLMIVCLWGAFSASPIIAFLCIIAFFIFGFALWPIFCERAYRPGKSFGGERASKKRLGKTVIYVGIATTIAICLICYFLYIEGHEIQSWIAYALTGIWSLMYFVYYSTKSIKVHEDVDFVTTSEVERIIGVEIGEKIQATYQNFDSSVAEALQEGANLMMISDKTIYFSFMENGGWSYVKKRISEICKIGILGENNQRIHLKLLFTDETSIMLHMETYGKATSNATLFLRKFLEVLDAVVLGTVDEKISSRRRVSVNQETKPIESQQSENREVRNLDLSETVMEGLRNATPVESGRVLEF